MANDKYFTLKRWNLYIHDAVLTKKMMKTSAVTSTGPPLAFQNHVLESLLMGLIDSVV